MFIDIHAHAYRKTPVFGCPFCTAEQLIEEYDKLDIDMGVVQPIVSPEVYSPQSNEDVLDMAEKYPDRIIPFCNIDPRGGKNSPTTNFTPILQHYKDRGCKGIGEVMPKLQIMDPKVQNLLYHAEKVGLSVTFDGSPQTDRGFGVYDDVNLPQLEMTLMSFPALIVFGHGPLFWSELARLETVGERGYIYTFDDRQIGMMGTGPIKEEGVVPKLMRKFPNLYGDLSDFTPCHMLSRDREFSAKFLTEFQDRLFFGTDMCFPGMNVPIISFLYEMRDSKMITNEVFEKISHKNAEKFLGIKVKK
ncbi:MAG: amidohydrolase family protein [Clostridia bacterium]|nr:amidohydrolase family protein [Clostridia bacterium]